MPVQDFDQPFDSIESAHDFMNVLAETVLDAIKELHDEEERVRGEGLDRRAQAIELALYKLKVLSCHVHKSRRTLNDLRTLRRLILEERTLASRFAAA